MTEDNSVPQNSVQTEEPLDKKIYKQAPGSERMPNSVSVPHIKEAVRRLKEKMKLCEVYKKDKDFNDLMDKLINEIFGEGFVNGRFR